MSRILCVVIYSLITELDVYITGPRTFGHSGSCRKGGGGCPPGEAVPGKGTGPAERTGPGQTKRQQGWRIMQVVLKVILHRCGYYNFHHIYSLPVGKNCEA